MNESEANKIINKHTIAYQEGHTDIFDSHKYGKAEGYLEAFYKARVLEDALKSTSKILTKQKFYKAQGRLLTEVDEALAKWEKEK